METADEPREGEPFALEVYAPDARRVEALVDGLAEPVALTRADDRRRGSWVGDVPTGGTYVLRVDESTLVLDPGATAVHVPRGHRRAAHVASAASAPALATFPRAIARPWPSRRSGRRTTRPLVVYEAHVRGLTRRRARSDAGTYRAAIDELPRLRSLGISVLELLPVHQFDPDEDNYWGYMPMVFGAVHAQYAAGDDPAAELADLVGAAHDQDIEVWLDVVVNHTTEGDRSGPTYTLRSLAERDYYVVDRDGSYCNDAGTGNIVDAYSPMVRRLIMESLDRFADLGVDGFRFDLAAVLARDPDFVRSIGDWAERREVRLVAEPWDLARYLLGPDFPDQRWAQWNGQYRDDVRGFLRGEPGLVGLVATRVAGSPDLVESPDRSINFLTAHDGFTMYDLMAYDHRHNEANGEGNADGHHHTRSWNSGWEGDVDVPDEVMALRRQRLRSAMAVLLLSRGTPMFVAGDEAARTQRGNNNAYNQDNEISWLDWDRMAAFGTEERFVGRLLELRVRVPAIVDERADDPLRFHGASGELDRSFESRSLAWSVDGLYVVANMWWEPVEYEIQRPGRWRIELDTSRPDGPDGHAAWVDGRIRVPPRSVVALTPDG